MSIIIKGVTLNDIKPFCPCLNGEYGDCGIPGIKRCYGIGKDGCPLVEIPPHGRLGDLDELEKSFREDADAEWNRFATPLNWADAFDDVADIVADAPTIIPAEEGKS